MSAIRNWEFFFSFVSRRLWFPWEALLLSLFARIFPSSPSSPTSFSYVCVCVSPFSLITLSFPPLTPPFPAFLYPFPFPSSLLLPLPLSPSPSISFSLRNSYFTGSPGNSMLRPAVPRGLCCRLRAALPESPHPGIDKCKKIYIYILLFFIRSLKR